MVKGMRNFTDEDRANAMAATRVISAVGKLDRNEIEMMKLQFAKSRFDLRVLEGQKKK